MLVFEQHLERISNTCNDQGQNKADLFNAIHYCSHIIYII